MADAFDFMAELPTFEKKKMKETTQKDGELICTEKIE